LKLAAQELGKCAVLDADANACGLQLPADVHPHRTRPVDRRQRSEQRIDRGAADAGCDRRALRLIAVAVPGAAHIAAASTTTFGGATVSAAVPIEATAAVLAIAHPLLEALAFLGRHVLHPFHHRLSIEATASAAASATGVVAAPSAAVLITRGAIGAALTDSAAAATLAAVAGRCCRIRLAVLWRGLRILRRCGWRRRLRS
jgi:hypothetical protein